jgi:hypothetical protein
MRQLELLHKAASHLRKVADDAAIRFQDAWAEMYPVSGPYVVWKGTPELNAFLRVMSPNLAIAVADWLMFEADLIAKSFGDQQPDDEAIEEGCADVLAVARAILGEGDDVR